MINKTELRKKYKQIRGGLSAEFVRGASDEICGFICRLEAYEKASSVLLYNAIGNEVSLERLIGLALSQNKTVLMPVTDPETETMHVSKIRSMDDVVCGAYNIAEPKDKTVFDIEKIDVAVVPGLVFGRRGYRIGYGKGYYDKFLSQNPDIFKIGAAYSCQTSDEDFGDTLDVRLDAIATEKGVIFCEDI